MTFEEARAASEAANYGRHNIRANSWRFVPSGPCHARIQRAAPQVTGSTIWVWHLTAMALAIINGMWLRGE